MPVGVVVNQSEAVMIRKLWSNPEAGEPKMVTGCVVEFSPSAGSRILARLEEHRAEIEDSQAYERFRNRIADICGPSLFAYALNPVEAAVDPVDKDTSTESSEGFDEQDQD